MGKSSRLWPANAIREQAPRTYRAIAADNYLQGLDPGEFVAHLAEHWGEINTGGSALFGEELSWSSRDADTVSTGCPIKFDRFRLEGHV